MDRDVGLGVGVPSRPFCDILSDSLLISSIGTVDVAEGLDVGVRVQLGCASDKVAIRRCGTWARVDVYNNLEFDVRIGLDGRVDRIPCGTLRVLVKREQKFGSERRRCESKKERKGLHLHNGEKNVLRKEGGKEAACLGSRSRKT